MSGRRGRGGWKKLLLLLPMVIDSIRCFTYRVRAIARVDTNAIKQEANCIGHLALTVAERIHELLELGSPLDLEEHLVVVIGDFDVQVLRGTLVFWPCACR